MFVSAIIGNWLLPRTVAAVLLVLSAPTLVWAQNSDPLVELDISVTSGAAPGYVPDAVCEECHAEKAETFAEMGMAKSFYRPSTDNVIEDFEKNHFHHIPSNRHYEMELRDGDYWFRRYRLNAEGRKINLFERKVDWILGSGNHTRTYLYQTADGALFQLPLAWYTQGNKWQMAPGFEWERHLGVTRQVRRQCMFCHNAYPDVAAGSDRFGLEDVFPTELPHGIGCQRCHGPGGDHVRAVYAEDGSIETARQAIVNPAKLSRERLYGICYGCHMLPAVAVPAVRRFGRPAYSFRPGELLSDFRFDLDTKERGKAQSEKFEINHHPYRLEQSRCFIESDGELGCLTCHDPHVKKKPVERAAHYRKACLSCHGDGASGLDLGREAIARHPTIAQDDDCTICHMPERRTQDVVHVTMTDHLIAKDPGGLELIAPIEKEDADIEEVFARLGGAQMSADEQLIYKAVGVLRYTIGRYEPAAKRLQVALAKSDHAHFEPWLDLADSHLKRRDPQAALAIAREAKKRSPDHPKIAGIEASALYQLGRKQEAISLLEERKDINAVLIRRLAVMKAGLGEYEEALALAGKALELRNNLWTAWRLIGEIEIERGNYQQAVGAFANGLAIEPDDDRLRDGIVKALSTLKNGDRVIDYVLSVE